MHRKIEDLVSVVIIFALTITALVFKFLQDNFHVQVMDADTILVNIAFIFACVAGVITWREDRHLNLASVTDKLPEVPRKVVKIIVAAITPMILTQIFLISLCQIVNPEQFLNRLLWLPVKVFFAFYPLCYLFMLLFSVKRSEYRIASIAGVVLGVLTSMSAITGIIYYAGSSADLTALYNFGDKWNSFCGKAVWPLILILVALAFAGVPLFVIITGITFVTFSMSGGYTDVIPLEAYSKLSDKSIAAIPLFTIAGYILARGSAKDRFVNLFRALFGWFRGGTIVATVVVMTFFSTFTGVSGVTILALGSLLGMILTGSGYEKNRAEALVTSSGAIGLLFPPSVAIIMYATANYTVITQFEPGFDVTNLFIGALMPGALLALSMIVLGIIYDKNKNRAPFSISEIGKAFKECILELLLPILICLTYFTGFFNLFQVASFAVIYAFCLAAFFRKDFSFTETAGVVAESVPVSGGVLFIIGAAAGLSYFMQDANIPETVTEFITTYVSNKYLFLILMNLVLLVVGCLMDLYSAILIISPLLLYSANAYGIPVVQAGVIFLMNLSIGFLTPPVGMDLFISSYTFKKPVSEVIKGVLPFLLVQLGVLLLITYVPWFTTALLPPAL